MKQVSRILRRISVRWKESQTLFTCKCSSEMPLKTVRVPFSKLGVDVDPRRLVQY